MRQRVIYPLKADLHTSLEAPFIQVLWDDNPTEPYVTAPDVGVVAVLEHLKSVHQFDTYFLAFLAEIRFPALDRSLLEFLEDAGEVVCSSVEADTAIPTATLLLAEQRYLGLLVPEVDTGKMVGTEFLDITSATFVDYPPQPRIVTTAISMTAVIMNFLKDHRCLISDSSTNAN